MKTTFNQLSKENKEAVRSALNGNGLKVKDATIHKDGNHIALEIKKTGQIVKI